jgi:Zn-dependent oligopeptidase
MTMTAAVVYGVPGWDEPPLDMPTPTPDEIRFLTGAAIERADARMDAALAISEPTFEELFGALDDAAREIAIAYGQGAAQMMMAEDDAVRDAAFEANEQIEAWRAAVPMRLDVAEAIGRFADRTDPGSLDDLDRRYVERWQRDVRLAGANLPQPEREEIARLTARMLEISSAFYANVAKPNRITATAAELEGVPDSVRDAVTPIEGQPDRFELPVDGATIVGLMRQASNRDLRERAHRAWVSSGMPGNEPLLRELFELRRRLANLAGYPSWQAYRNENLASPSAAFTNEFIDDLAARLQPTARRDIAALTQVFRAQPGTPPDAVLENWDWRFVDAIQRDAIGVDQDELSQFFELESVLDGLAAVTRDVFGIRLEPRPERLGWDPGVRAYDLVDTATNRLIAHLFIDPWVRPGKQPGAWSDGLLPGGGRGGVNRPPTLSLCINTARPADGPALLSPYEVEVLFHEYGHVMNFAIAANGFVVSRLAWIPFDQVEGPSESLGRWGTQPPVLARFARHRVTGESIAVELMAAVERAAELNVSIEMLRVLGVAKFDALVHGERAIDIDEAYRVGWTLTPLPLVDGVFPPAGFTHIVGGGYDAAYYGYAWAEVIRDDLLERFAEGGLTSAEMGRRYRETLLQNRWIDDPLASIERFLGRPWAADAFLARAAAD